MADIELLKRLIEACDIEHCADEEERDRNLNEFYSVLEPEDVAALIAENEELAERIRLFELIHGGRASELYHQISALHDEVRRLKIAAGEPVPPLPEEFVGPMPERPYSRLRRKLQEQQKSAGGAGAAENCRCNEKAQVVQELQAELERARADAERASYWKQRAKSAEGHLLAGDFDVAAKALHKRTAMASTPWEELADDKRLQIQQAAFEVIHAVNSQRDERMPADAEMGKGGKAHG